MRPYFKSSIFVDGYIPKDKTTISVLGIKGFGKTVALKLFYHALTGGRIINIDSVGVMGNLPGINVKGYLDTPEHRFKLFQMLFEKHMDMGYNIDLAHVANPTVCIEGLSDLIIKNRYGSTAILIDEATDYLRQGKTDNYSKNLEKLIRIGRNWGVQPIILTAQRSTYIDKDVLALSDFYVFFKQIHTLDLDRIKEMVGMNRKEFEPWRKSIQALEKQECVTFDGVEMKVRKTIKYK